MVTKFHLKFKYVKLCVCMCTGRVLFKTLKKIDIPPIRTRRQDILHEYTTKLFFFFNLSQMENLLAKTTS